MSTKVNPLAIANATRPRIVIEFDPQTGDSTLKTSGSLNMMGIAICLSTQLNALLPRMFAEMFKNTALVAPSGQPVANEPPAMPQEPEPSKDSVQ